MKNLENLNPNADGTVQMVIRWITIDFEYLKTYSLSRVCYKIYKPI